MSYPPSEKKPSIITRSQNTINPTSSYPTIMSQSNINRNINRNSSSITSSYNKQSVNVVPSWSRSKQKQSIINDSNSKKSNSNSNKKQQYQHQHQDLPNTNTNIFYSQLHIETNDIDVPLVKILKINQQLMKQFIYHSNALQLMFKLHNMNHKNFAFRRLSTNLLHVKKYHLNVMKVNAVVDNIKMKKLQYGMMKLFAVRNKYRIKQKSLVVIKRLLIAKINSYYRDFLKNCSQKKLLKLLLQQSQQDEILKLKVNLQIMRQITFSKQFVTKCKVLTKYDTSNKGLAMFQKQLLKQNIQQSIKSQLQRYEKLRQNVDNINPNNNINNTSSLMSSTSIISSSSRSLPKRKLTNTSQSTVKYENQIVLLAMRSFNLSLVDIKKHYEEKISLLQKNIQQLQQQERYVEIEGLYKQEQQMRRYYDGVVNQLYRVDEVIKKAYGQFKQCLQKGKESKQVQNRLTQNLQSQHKRYNQLLTKLQNNKTNKQTDTVMIRFYGSRCFYLEMTTFILDRKQQQLNKQRDKNEFLIKILKRIVKGYQREETINKLVEEVMKNNNNQNIQYEQVSIVLVSVSKCILALHTRYQSRIKSMEQSLSNQLQQLKQQQKQQKSQQQQLLRKGQKQKQKQIQRQQFQTRQISTQTIQQSTYQKQNSDRTPQINLIKQKSAQQVRKLDYRSIQTQTEYQQKYDMSLSKQDTGRKLKYQQQQQQQQKQQQKQPQAITETQPNYNLLQQLITKSIYQYIQAVTNSYQQQNNVIQTQNIYLKKHLLPQQKGRQRLQQNILINSIVRQLNQHIIKVVNSLGQSVVLCKQEERLNKQMTNIVEGFYQMVLGERNFTNNSGSGNKVTESDKKWTQLVNSYKNKRSKTYNQETVSLINKLNEIFIVFKQIQSTSSSSSLLKTTTSKTDTSNKKPTNTQSITTRNDFSQQLKRILKQKLQYQRKCHQIQSKYFITKQQHKLIQQQNKQYKQKLSQMQKQLNKYKQQSIVFSDKQQQYRLTIQRVSGQLQVYIRQNKKEIDENNLLNKEIYMLKRKVEEQRRERDKINNQRELLIVELKEIKQRLRQRKRSIIQSGKEQQMQKWKLQDVGEKKQQHQLKQRQQQIQSQTISIHEYKLLNNSLKMQVTQLQQTLNHLYSQRDSLNNQIYQLKRQLYQQQMISKEMKFQKQRKQLQLQGEKKKNKQFVQVQVAYQVRIDRLEEQIKQLKQRVSRLNGVIKQYQSRKIMDDKQGEKNQHIESNQQKGINIIAKTSQQHKHNISSEFINQQTSNTNNNNNHLTLRIQQLQRLLTQKQQQLKYTKKQHQQNKTLMKQQHQEQTTRLKQFYSSQLSQLQKLLNNQSIVYERSLEVYKQKLEQLIKSSSIGGNKVYMNDFKINDEDNDSKQQKQPNRQHLQHQSFNTTNTTTFNNNTNNYQILSFNPQQQILSLKQFITTLQRQNMHLNNKYQKLKKELYYYQSASDNYDQVSTVYSVRSNKTNDNIKMNNLRSNSSVEFYQSLINDLKVQNDRLYDQLLRLKHNNNNNSNKLLSVVGDSDSDNNNNNSRQIMTQQQQQHQQFWLSELKNKQLIIQEKQKIIINLKHQLQLSQQERMQISRSNMDKSIYERNNITVKVEDNTKQINYLQQQQQQHQHNQHSITIKHLQLVIQTKQQLFKQKQTHYNERISSLQQQLVSIQQHCKQQIINIRKLYQHERQQLQYSKQQYVDYEKLLIIFKQVKQLYGEYTTVTKKVLQKMMIVMVDNNNNNSQQQQQHHHNYYQQLIAQFRTIILNNEQTLSTIYANIVTNNTVRRAMQLHYLKELTFNIVSKFYLPYYHHHSYHSYQLNTGDHNNSNNQVRLQSLSSSSYTDLVSKQLYQEINKMFLHSTSMKKNQQQHINQQQQQQQKQPTLSQLSIQEVFTNMQQFITTKIQLSLDSYKQQLHAKAVQLQHMHKQLNLIVQSNLIQQGELINVLPINRMMMNRRMVDCQQQQQQQQGHINCPYGDCVNFHHHHGHNYQYHNNRPFSSNINSNANNNNNSYLPIVRNNPFIVTPNGPHNSIDNNNNNIINQGIQSQPPFPSPYPNNYVSNKSSNYQYRPQTTLIDKYDLMQQQQLSIPQSDRVLLYRSSANPYLEHYRHHSHNSSYDNN